MVNLQGIKRSGTRVKGVVGQVFLIEIVWIVAVLCVGRQWVLLQSSGESLYRGINGGGVTEAEG